MEELGIPFDWSGGAISGIILFVIFSIVKGWLVPKPMVDRLLREKDRTIEVQQDLIESQREIAEPTKKLLETMSSAAARNGVDAT